MGAAASLLAAGALGRRRRRSQVIRGLGALLSFGLAGVIGRNPPFGGVRTHRSPEYSRSGAEGALRHVTGFSITRSEPAAGSRRPFGSPLFGEFRMPPARVLLATRVA